MMRLSASWGFTHYIVEGSGMLHLIHISLTFSSSCLGCDMNDKRAAAPPEEWEERPPLVVGAGKGLVATLEAREEFKAKVVVDGVLGNPRNGHEDEEGENRVDGPT